MHSLLKAFQMTSLEFLPEGVEEFMHKSIQKLVKESSENTQEESMTEFLEEQFQNSRACSAQIDFKFQLDSLDNLALIMSRSKTIQDFKSYRKSLTLKKIANFDFGIIPKF